MLKMWRGGSPPLGCEAAPLPAAAIQQLHRGCRIYDCCAAERGQAPSPQIDLSTRVKPTRCSASPCTPRQSPG
ncbi:hypothetical protein PSJE_12755 [Pseudomonas jessenii]|nr:hypothetical protein PSJE_12755 [Pseudomonas jessenii]